MSREDKLMTVLRPLHPSNVSYPMRVTPSGIVMLVSPVQPKNAEFPMLVTELGMVMLVSPVHL